MTQIRLHCVVCDNAIDYFKYLLSNYRDLASKDAQIEVIAHCTDDPSYRLVQEQKLADHAVAANRHPEFYVYGNRVDIMNRIKLFCGVGPALSGSSGHATGSRSAFSLSGGGKIDVIADTDTVIVYPEWDKLLEDRLQKVGMISTSYEDKGSVCAGTGAVQNHKASPNMTWMALSPRYDFRKADPSHRLYLHKPVRTKEQAELYGLQIGDKLLCDVGWKLPSFLKENNIPAKILTHAKPGSPNCKVIRTANEYNEEFHLDGIPLIVHQRGSRKHPYRTQPLSAPFYEAAERYIAEHKKVA